MLSRSLCFTLVLFGFALGLSRCEADDRPNIVMVLVDDMGYGDLNTEIMPRCSQIAQLGSQLSFYTQQNCMPTRAALMSGKIPARFDLHSVLPTPMETGMPAGEKMVSEYLQETGYRTGIFGKWHLGWKSRDQWPNARGFDEFIGCLGGHLNSFGSPGPGQRYIDGTTGHDHHTIHDFQFNGVPFYTKEYSSFVFRDASIRFIEKSVKKEEPFFLYVPFNAPHGPFSAPRSYVEHAATLPDVDPSVIPQLGTYAGDVLAVPYGSDAQLYRDSDQLLYKAMVRALDDAVADIYESLEINGIADNTLFMFASDNGPAYSKNPVKIIGDNAWLRGHKGSPHEGGHFVANFVVWPDRINSGQTIQSNVWVGDLAPTFLDIAGLPIPADMDGGSMLPAIDSDVSVNRNFGGKRIYPHISKSISPSWRTDISGQSTVTINRGWQKYIRFFEYDLDGNVLAEGLAEEFYDLRFDPSEENNVVDHPSYQRLLNSMRNSYQGMGGDDFMESIALFGRPTWAGFVVTEDFGFEDTDNPTRLVTELNP